MSPVEFYISCTRNGGHAGIRISIGYRRTNSKGEVAKLFCIQEPEQAYRSTVSSSMDIERHIHTLVYFKIRHYLHWLVSRIYSLRQLDIVNILLSRKLR